MFKPLETGDKFTVEYTVQRQSMVGNPRRWLACFGGVEDIYFDNTEDGLKDFTITRKPWVPKVGDVLIHKIARAKYRYTILCVIGSQAWVTWDKIAQGIGHAIIDLEHYEQCVV